LEGMEIATPKSCPSRDGSGSERGNSPVVYMRAAGSLPALPFPQLPSPEPLADAPQSTPQLGRGGLAPCQTRQGSPSDSVRSATHNSILVQARAGTAPASRLLLLACASQLRLFGCSPPSILIFSTVSTEKQHHQRYTRRPSSRVVPSKVPLPPPLRSRDAHRLRPSHAY
jgi:hypothetical protein